MQTDTLTEGISLNKGQTLIISFESENEFSGWFVDDSGESNGDRCNIKWLSLVTPYQDGSLWKTHWAVQMPHDFFSDDSMLYFAQFAVFGLDVLSPGLTKW